MTRLPSIAVHRQTLAARGAAPLVPLLLSCVLFALSEGLATGQQKDDTHSPRVMIGKDKTSPGGDAFVPILFGSSVAEPVGTIIFDIHLSDEELVFQEVRGTGAEGITATGVAGKDPSDARKTLLRVRIENKNGAL